MVVGSAAKATVNISPGGWLAGWANAGKASSAKIAKSAFRPMNFLHWPVCVFRRAEPSPPLIIDKGILRTRQ
jgi:hypothetical protein